MGWKAAAAATMIGMVALPASAAPVTVAPATAAPAGSAAQSRFDAAIAAAKRDMMADADLAFRRASAARGIALHLPAGRSARLALATAMWLQGEALIGLNQPERAGPIIDQALREVVAAAPRSKLNGDLLRSRGAVSAILGRVQPALADFQQAHDIFRAAGERRSQAMALQEIGAIYLDAGDYERVLRYYAQAAEAYDGDPNLLVTTYNNRANALGELKRYGQAEAEYGRALAAARAMHSAVLQVRILTNLAHVQLLGGHLPRAAASLIQARAIAASDPAATGWTPFIAGVEAQVALRRGDAGAAAALIGRTFAGVDLRTTNMSYRDFHSAAHDIYQKIGDDRLALAHLEAFKRLDDEARTLAASTNAQLMAAQFDFANQDLKITRLRAEKLQRDALLERSRARLRTTILVGALSAAAIVLALLLYGYFRIRRSRNEVRAANRDLSLSNEALEKALKAKTEFLAMTSHEIRTPLNGILGMTQVILADRRIDGPTRERLEVVRGAGEAMRGLVDDILDVAKMEKGRLILDPVELDLSAMLANVASLWSDQARDKGLAWEVTLADSPRRIRADESRLRQIISNLLSNAVKFTAEGKVGLVARATGPADDERLVVEVSDTGVGIPAEAIESIFESFRQVDAGTTRRFGGTGLGLAICRNLAEAMGGTIEVDSVIGEGSRFRLILPLERLADPVEAEPADAARADTLDASAVLLLEANPLTQSILRAVLTRQVASLTIAGNVEDGRRLLESRPFDQVLVDGALLSAGGADPVATLAALMAGSPARWTATWPQPAPELVAALLDLGVVQVLARPIAPAALADALRSVCEGDKAETSDYPMLTVASA